MAAMKHVFSLALFLAALWWVLSGQATPGLLGLGLASVALVTVLAGRMAVIDHESHPIHMSGGLTVYWGRLAVEIVASNLDVLRRILAPRLRIEPHFLRVRTGQPTALGKVILANSITLTPGTVTVDVQGDELLVHALTRAGGEVVAAGQLDRLVPRDCEAGP